MSYRRFTYKKVMRAFGLKEAKANLFADAAPWEVSDWLHETLKRTLSYGLPTPSGKAKSEF
jgi:hypothetical protein